MMPYFTFIHGGDIFTPEPKGSGFLLLGGGTILDMGMLAQPASFYGPVEVKSIAAQDCWVFPGLIDPHSHLIGAAGEQGFSSRTSPIELSELLLAGITTVVGCLGTDTVTRHLTSLFAKVRQLQDQGLYAWMYTGGFCFPPKTMTGSVQRDVVLIDPVIGLGELAIADARSSQPALHELARLVNEVRVGGTIASKAGVTHFHVGPGKEKLSVLHTLLDRFEVIPESIYPTHCNRSSSLLQDAILLEKRGCYVDMDTVEENVEESILYYLKQGGRPERFTISSDAHTKDADSQKYYQQLIACIQSRKIPIEIVLAGFTKNVASALKLSKKGTLAVGKDADILVISKKTFQVEQLFIKGRHLVQNGVVIPLKET